MFIGCSLQISGFLFRYKMEDIGYSRTQVNIGSYAKNVSKCFFSETTWTIETKLPRNDHWKILYQVFYADRKSKMAAGHRLILDPMGKCLNAFFSETTNQTESKLQSLGILFRYEIENGGYGRIQFNIGSYRKNVSKRFFSETTWTIETKQ